MFARFYTLEPGHGQTEMSCLRYLTVSFGTTTFRMRQADPGWSVGGGVDNEGKAILVNWFLKRI